MTNEELQKIAKDLADLDIQTDPDIVQDMTGIPAPCIFDSDRCDPSEKTLRLNLSTGKYRCTVCPQTGLLSHYVKKAKEFRPSPPPPSDNPVIDAEFTEVGQQAKPPGNPDAERLKQNGKPQTEPERNPPKPSRSLEHPIIATLAVIFVIAGLGAAALSGFANYGAFSATVSDPLQARIWGWSGVIASIISFGGFTFVYWHGAHRRWKEAFRTALFAFAAAATSVYGTQLYIAGNAAANAADLQAATSNRAVLEAQIADWRAQLDGIPADTRSVEGLEAYIAEVERVGRSEQKPYRDAQNELGLAKRRDALEGQINAANAELLGTGTRGIAVSATDRPAPPAWLFAILLELFSSQGTSIGAVALLLLTGRRDRLAKA